jgi:hypothetical protein
MRTGCMTLPRLVIVDIVMIDETVRITNALAQIYPSLWAILEYVFVMVSSEARSEQCFVQTGHWIADQPKRDGEVGREWVKFVAVFSRSSRRTSSKSSRAFTSRLLPLSLGSSGGDESPSHTFIYRGKSINPACCPPKLAGTPLLSLLLPLPLLPPLSSVAAVANCHPPASVKPSGTRRSSSPATLVSHPREL